MKRLLVGLATAGVALAAAPASASAAYADTVTATPGLASYWRLGETRGTTALDVRRIRTGTYLNGVRLGQPPAPFATANTSAAFDGSNDAVSLGDAYDHSGTAAFSVELWLRPSRVGAATVWRRVLSKEAPDGTGYLLSIAPDSAGASAQQLVFERRSSTGADAVSSTTALAADSWSHVAVTFDGTTLRVYRHGRLEATQPSRRSLPNTRASLRLGAASSGHSHLGGQLDDVSVYSRALSSATVAQHHAAGVAQASPPVTTPVPSPVPITSPKASTRPAGALVLGDLEAAARVRRSSWEPRPENAEENRRMPTPAELDRFRTENATWGDCHVAHVRRVTGQFEGTTDEILQWASHKWGIDEDVARAIAVNESTWRMSMVGDAGQSFGILQVKRTVHLGTYPIAELSTAFNADYWGMMVRQYLDGCASWLGTGYAPGDLWGSLGAWYSGMWHDAGAEEYNASAQRHLTARPWEGAGF